MIWYKAINNPIIKTRYPLQNLFKIENLYSENCLKIRLVIKEQDTIINIACELQLKARNKQSVLKDCWPFEYNEQLRNKKSTPIL